MNVGDIFVLVDRPPYHHFSGHNTKKPTFIEIEVIEKHTDVPHEFDAEELGEGFVAKGSDGYTYGYNYPRVSGAWETTWHRHMPDDEFMTLSEEKKDEICRQLVWYDVIRYQVPTRPIFADDFSRKIHFCEKHQNLYYEGGTCFYCKMNFTPEDRITMNTIDHAFVGWVEKDPSNQTKYEVVWMTEESKLAITLSSVHSLQLPYTRHVDMFVDHFDMTMVRIDSEVGSGRMDSGDPSKGNMPKNIARALRKEARRRKNGKTHCKISRSVIF